MRINSFTKVAKNYTTIVSPRRYNQFLALINELELKGNETVLDIGTGAGVLSVEIARALNKGGFLQGIDLSSKMTKMAKLTAVKQNMTNTSFKTASALRLPFDDSSFDVVASSNAFPWVPDRELFLKEVYRVLKPGGRLGLVALSNDCYREFTDVLKKISKESPRLFPSSAPFELMGAKLHSTIELGKMVAKVGFSIHRNFQFSIVEEQIGVENYLDRINAIVNENYLDHLKSVSQRAKLKSVIVSKMNSRKNNKKITESSIFVIADKLKMN